MLLISEAFDGMDVWYTSTDEGQLAKTGISKGFGVSDYNQNQPLKVLAGFAEMRRVLREIRPNVVVSTGAAPGLVGMCWGRLYGAHTIWVDSIANSERLSLSGRLALKLAHSVYTQWDHLSEADRPKFKGSIF